MGNPSTQGCWTTNLYVGRLFEVLLWACVFLTPVQGNIFEQDKKDWPYFTPLRNQYRSSSYSSTVQDRFIDNWLTTPKFCKPCAQHVAPFYGQYGNGLAKSLMPRTSEQDTWRTNWMECIEFDVHIYMLCVVWMPKPDGHRLSTLYVYIHIYIYRHTYTLYIMYVYIYTYHHHYHHQISDIVNHHCN